MARAPDGTLSSPADDPGGFVRGLEGTIDRALERHPRGETFLYGIHQELDAATGALLVERYRAAGWSEVHLREGLTGAFNLILIP